MSEIPPGPIEWRQVAPGVERAEVPYRELDDGRRLRLRVHRALGAPGAPRPMVLDLHGGAWTHFHPAVDDGWCRALARRGHLVAGAEFRRSGDGPWPAPIEDAAAAAVWLRRHGDALGGEVASLGAMGGSTGGHMALMCGLVPLPGGELDWVAALWPIVDVPARWVMVSERRFDPVTRRLADRIEARGRSRHGDGEPDLGETADRLARLDSLRRRRPRLGDVVTGLIQGVNAVAPLTPLPRCLLYRRLAAAHRATFEPTFGTGGPTEPSPIHVVRRGDAKVLPRTLVVHAALDANTTRSMSESYADAVRAAGGDIELVVARGLGHSYGNLPSRAADELVDRLDRFARRS